jgi:hypothetical protein
VNQVRTNVGLRKEKQVDDTNGGPRGGFDELKQAVAEEERNRSFGFVEEPQAVQIRCDFVEPLNWLFASTDLAQFATHLNRLLRVLPQDVKLQADENPRAILLQTVLQGEDLVFSDGALDIEDLGRTVQISTIRLSTRKIYVRLDSGTTAEARWVVQKTIELLLLSSSLSLSWSNFVDKIEAEAHSTRTKAYLGVDLIDLFSHRFKDFVQNDLAKTDSLGTRMGTHPRDKRLRETEEGAIIVVPQIHGVEVRLSLFNKITGRSEDCELRLDIWDRRDYGQGILTITTELDSVLHTQLINQLRSTILDQSKM